MTKQFLYLLLEQMKDCERMEKVYLMEIFFKSDTSKTPRCGPILKSRLKLHGLTFFLRSAKNMNDHLAPLIGNPCSNHYTIATAKHTNNRKVKQITTTSAKVYCIKSYKLKFKINKQLEVMNAEYSRQKW